MWRTSWKLLALASIVLGAPPPEVSGRPLYGGLLRVETRGLVRQLDPAIQPGPADDVVLKNTILALLADRLVVLGSTGLPRPALASSWDCSSDFRRWTFSLDPRAQFHDGSPVTAEAVSMALNSVQNEWTASPGNGRVIIQAGTPRPALAYELASPVLGIIKRGEDGVLTGTGPFQLVSWEPDRKAVLRAFEEYRSGRPFVDGVEITMNRGLREQLIDLELGRADLIEVPLHENRTPLRNGSILTSGRSRQLIALVFGAAHRGPVKAMLREAVAKSVDRTAIHNILLQKQGEPGGSLLPDWMTGYASLFPANRDLGRARSLVASIPTIQLTLGYRVDDPLDRAIAERVALDASVGGLRIKAVAEPANSAASDLRLARTHLSSSDPASALLDLCSRLRVPRVAERPATAQQDFDYEFKLLQDFTVIPLFHVPISYGISKRLRATADLEETLGFDWQLEDVWIAETQSQTPARTK